MTGHLKVGCLHPVACTRSGSGFPSNATLVRIFYLVTLNMTVMLISYCFAIHIIIIIIIIIHYHFFHIGTVVAMHASDITSPGTHKRKAEQ
jgi:hypothetical protein